MIALGLCAVAGAAGNVVVRSAIRVAFHGKSRPGRLECLDIGGDVAHCGFVREDIGHRRHLHAEDVVLAASVVVDATGAAGARHVGQRAVDVRDLRGAHRAVEEHHVAHRPVVHPVPEVEVRDPAGEHRRDGARLHPVVEHAVSVHVHRAELVGHHVVHPGPAPRDGRREGDGVAAAAQHYFNKSLDDLTIEEVAYLAALPKAPNNYHPTRKTERAITRRNWVIGRMADDGHISNEQAEMAKATNLDVIDVSDLAKSVRAPYFAEEIRRKLQDEFGNDGLYKEGLIVKSSINPRMQEIAAEALRDGLVAYDLRHGYRKAVTQFSTLDNWKNQLNEVERQQGMLEDWKLAVILDDLNIGFKDGSKGKISREGKDWAGDKVTNGSVIMVEKDADDNIYRLRQVPEVQGGIVIMDPHTGRVLAIQGGWDYQKSEFNRATQAQRQPGSSFKPFIYLTALESGMTPATIVMDAPVAFSQGPGLPLWQPQNYSDKFYGPTTLRVGIEKSRNVMTVRLADRVGMDAIADTAKDFGIYDNMQKNLASSLGSNETTLMRMVTAYGMLVNGGKKIDPSFIDRIQNRYGENVFKRDKRQCPTCGPKILWGDHVNVPMIDDNREVVTDPKRAYQMTSILEGAIQRGTGVRLKNIGFPMAGKTGTTNDARDAWFIGFTPDLVFGAYVGFDQPKPLGRKETGSSVALPIIQQFLKTAYAEDLIDPVPFRVPPGVSLMQVNAKTGRRAYPGDQNIIWEAFMAGESPDMQTTVYGGDTVIFEEPDIDYNNLFETIPNPENPIPSESFNDPNSSVLQGTGGVY